MASLDEAVGNLQRFCGLLTQTSGALQEHTSSLESDAGEIDRLQGSAEDALGDLGEELDAFLSRLQDAGGRTVDAMEGLGGSARTLGDERVSVLEADVGASESAFEQRLDADQGALESGFSELTADGFEMLSSAIEGVEGGVEGSGQDAQAAFDGFGGSVDALAQQVEAFQGEAEAGIAEAADGLTGDVAQGLEAEAADCASAFADELPSELESCCAGIEGSVSGAYAGFGDEGLGKGDALMERVGRLADEAAAFVLEAQGGQVEKAGSSVVEQALPELLEQLAQVEQELEAGAALTGQLDPLVGELEIAKAVVAQVDELLSAIGG